MTTLITLQQRYHTARQRTLRKSQYLKEQYKFECTASYSAQDVCNEKIIKTTVFANTDRQIYVGNIPLISRISSTPLALSCSACVMKPGTCWLL
jgi:hypothetical protein